MKPWQDFTNAESLSQEQVPLLPPDDFFTSVDELLTTTRAVAYFARPLGNAQELTAVFADDAANRLLTARTLVTEPEIPHLSGRHPQLHRYERELAEYGLLSGPDLPRLRRPPLVGDSEEFHPLPGEDVHEVAVGPVHAGVIEPGHFRFQCRGETVYRLEIALGYQHRGLESAWEGGPNPRTRHYAETLAGDTTIAHTTAYARILEALSGTRVPLRAEALRALGLELERLANHVGDLGALAGDTGYLPTASFCGRIRGDFLNLTALVCGNRFGRGWVVPGGVAFDVDKPRAAELLKRLDILTKETTEAVNLLWSTSSVLARMEHIGPVTREQAQTLGLVGPAARASGLVRDVRFDQPVGLYRFQQIPVSTYDTGDVFSRAYVRWLEIQKSLVFVHDLVKNLPSGALNAPVGALKPNHLAVALEEAWRGEAAHAAWTSSDGKLARYKVIDPSFHNWTALEWALKGQEISDFPLCNKSFNLSYCGHDL